ncbi:MAG TPA: hypothetical protein VES02_16350 [Dermatophilaceae bacterium]|nr:hypothetical protein [Dermatophilaceae bacterium]
MDVIFAKAAGRRYLMSVRRERGPTLAPRFGPGYHDYLPHDAVHFLVEAEAELTGGVFGRIAQGHSNLFWPVDPAQQRRQRRREAKRRITPGQHADMQRSEALASAGRVLWEIRAGLGCDVPAWAVVRAAEAAHPALMERVLVRLDDFAATWHRLAINESICLAWPVPTPSPHGLPDHAQARITSRPSRH